MVLVPLCYGTGHVRQAKEISVGNGALKIVSGVAKNRHERKFVKVGQWAV
jgi:hypothetical protein